MSLSAATVWEVRPGATGASANNGGGFVAGATGTDFSQQNSPQYNAADLSGTSANTATPAVTSASHSFVGADVGNLIHITAGTNWTAGFYQIVSVAAGAAILDRACASVASPTSGTYAVGGALNSIMNASSAGVAGNIYYSKNTGNTDTLSGNHTFTSGSLVAPTRWEGYNATRGDIRTALYDSIHTAAGFLDTTNFPSVDVGAANQITLGSFMYMVGIKCTGARTTTRNVNASTGCDIYRCSIGGTGVGTAFSLEMTAGSCSVRDCDLSATSQAGSYAVSGNTVTTFIGNRVTSTSGGGITFASGSNNLVIAFNTFYTLAASQIAVQIVSVNGIVCIVNNTFDGIAGTCITVPDAAQTSPSITIDNNQITNCGTFANNLRVATQAIPFSGQYNRIRDTSTSYTGWYDNNASVGDITSAQADADEYTNRGSNNFTLKSGAAGKAGGAPRYLDIGSMQRKEPTLPTAAQVLTGIGFGDAGTEFTGTVVQPSTANVRNGTTFGASSGSTGTLVVPSVGNVRSGITFDNGSVGTVVIPAVGDVRLGTAFDTSSIGTLAITTGGSIIGG